MSVNVAINGYGRIGRNIMRALYESGRNNEIRIVAINDLAEASIWTVSLSRFVQSSGPW